MDKRFFQDINKYFYKLMVKTVFHLESMWQRVLYLQEVKNR